MRIRIWAIGGFIAIGATSGVARAQTRTAPAASAGYRIAGIAVDAVSGKPLARAEVSIESQEDKKVHEAYVTGTDGRFSFEGLTAGRYTLLAGRRGYMKQTYKSHEEFSTAIVVGPGWKTDEVRFAMTLGASIAGQVIDERGDVVRNARVLLLREASTGRGRRLTRAGSKYTDDLGAYRFGHLGAGVYVVAVTSRVWYADAAPTGVISIEPPFGGVVDTDVVYPVTFYPAATDADVATRITLTEGENATANVSISPVQAQRVTIPNHYDERSSVGIISVMQYIADGIAEEADFRTSIGSDGIDIARMPPSRVDVSWVTFGKTAEHHLTRLNLTGKVEGNSAETVVHGVLDVGGGMKAAGMTVKLAYANGGKPFSAVVGEKGEFEFREEMVGGKYSVEVPQAAEAAVGIRAEGADVAEGSLEIVPGRDVHLKIFAARAGRVRGTILKDGKVAEGMLVVLVPEKFEEANNLMRVDQSDSDGAFRMGDVVPGKYTLIAVENGWDADWRSAEFLGRFAGGGKKLEIGAGAVVTEQVEAQEAR